MLLRILVILVILFELNACEFKVEDDFSLLQGDLKSCIFPPDTSGKQCRLRESLINRNIWNHWAGFLCYYYTNTYRLEFRYENATAGFDCDGEITIIPITLINATAKTFFWYDYTNKTSLRYLRESFKTESFFELWKSCCEQADHCCNDTMTNSNIEYSPTNPCPTIWDGWTCFDSGTPGTISKEKCSNQAYSSDTEVCVLESEKECFTWGWNQTTDYSVCSLAPMLRARHNFHVIFLAVAAGLAFPAIIIFLSFRKFRVTTRFCLHRNLIGMIILRNILTIMAKEIVILDYLNTKSGESVMEENSVACRVLAFFENAAKNGIYACMLVDGFYLHKSIVRIFANEPKMVYLYVVVVVLTFLPSLIWAIVRASREAENCWMVDTQSDQWIPDGFRLAILAINAIFLIDIIRVMLMNLKQRSTTQQAKTAFRATLLLVPLFGLHIIFTANRGIINSDTCYAENTFYYISYSLEALQGILVATLFCYMNSEVHTEIKEGWRKFSIFVENRYGVQLRRETVFRRATTATYVNPVDMK